MQTPAKAHFADERHYKNGDCQGKAKDVSRIHGLGLCKNGKNCRYALNF
jgi:hypothetical protein